MNSHELANLLGALDLILLLIIIFGVRRKSKSKHRIHLKIVFSFYNYKKHLMPIKNLTLENHDPKTLALSVVDANNKNAVIPGVLSNILVVVSDASQDTAGPNADNPTAAIDVEALTDTGGTDVTVTADFTSTETNPDSTPKVSGPVSGVITLLNNIVVKAVLAFDPA